MNALRDSSLYFFNMLTYADAEYLAKVQAINRRAGLSKEGKNEREAGTFH